METPPRPLLYFAGELRGDYNADGAVNAADYTVWRDSLGSVSNLAADGDHNGVVNDDDRLVWQANFGAVAAPPAMVAVTVRSVADAAEPISEALAPGSFAFVVVSDTVVAPETARSYRPNGRVTTLAPRAQRDLLLFWQSQNDDNIDREANRDVERSEGAARRDASPGEWVDFDSAFERLGSALR